ncbi:STY0301 family protein, partial [Salmonella enterica]|uniref:STY0301 family protein n=1 Tax=Salmonella enterica TaxID=28901 RepID=UPI0032995E62
MGLKADVPAPWQRSPRCMSGLWLSSIGVTQGKPEKLMDLKPETKEVNGENWAVWETERVSDKETD